MGEFFKRAVFVVISVVIGFLLIIPVTSPYQSFSSAPKLPPFETMIRLGAVLAVLIATTIGINTSTRGFGRRLARYFGCMLGGVVVAVIGASVANALAPSLGWPDIAMGGAFVALPVFVFYLWFTMRFAPEV